MEIKDFVKPNLIKEDLKHIIGNSSSSNAEELYKKYIEIKFQPCYQLANAIVQIYSNLDSIQLMDNEFGDAISSCRLALEDYQQSSNTLDDKKEFCSYVEAGCNKSFYVG